MPENLHLARPDVQQLAHARREDGGRVLPMLTTPPVDPHPTLPLGGAVANAQLEAVAGAQACESAELTDLALQRAQHVLELRLHRAQAFAAGFVGEVGWRTQRA